MVTYRPDFDQIWPRKNDSNYPGTRHKWGCRYPQPYNSERPWSFGRIGQDPVRKGLSFFSVKCVD